MTEQAGSNNKPAEEAGPPPWERTWNDVKDVASKAVDTVVGTTKKVVEGAKKPWEMSWGGSMPKEATESPATFKVPSTIGPLNTEKQAIAAAQFTPEELKQQEISMRSPGSIAELKQEIKRTKNPKDKAVLQELLDEITKG